MVTAKEIVNKVSKLYYDRSKQKVSDDDVQEYLKTDFFMKKKALGDFLILDSTLTMGFFKIDESYMPSEDYSGELGDTIKEYFKDSSFDSENYVIAETKLLTMDLKQKVINVINTKVDNAYVNKFITFISLMTDFNKKKRGIELLTFYHDKINKNQPVFIVYGSYGVVISPRVYM